MKTVAGMRRDLAGDRSCESIATQALSLAELARSKGHAVFQELDAAKVLAQARALDAFGSTGVRGSLYGIPVSIKDLFDVAGERTMCGSPSRAETPLATEDAAAVAALRAKGAIIFGRTTMTEFAYSGLGINTHFGTPANPAFTQEVRIPGGSSSGGAVSVALGIAAAALCSDTGGSARIPAALCGLVGYKPTQGLLPGAGMFPLSPTLDTLGVIARTVDCISVVAGALASHDLRCANDEFDLVGLRIAVITNFFFDGCDNEVANAFERSVKRLEKAGALVRRISVASLNRFADANSKGGFQAAEAYHLHREELERADCRIEPRIASRIARGRTQSAADYLVLQEARQAITKLYLEDTRQFDIVAVPTVPTIAPTLASLAEDADYFKANLLLLRNPSVVNFVGGCAVSVANHPNPGDAPCGLMLVGRAFEDGRLLSIARAVEKLVSHRVICAHP